LNTLLKPILVKLSLPFLLVTAGLFYFIINAGLLFLVSYLVKDFEVDGFVPALLGALVITAVSVVCGFFIGDKNAK
jgi:putative membrane protein